MKMLLILGLGWAASAHAAPGAHGPNGEHLDAPASVNASGLMRLPDGSVNVPILAQRRLGVRTLMAVESEAATSVELPGRIVMDPNAGGYVQTVVGGLIEPGPEGLPVTGQTVKKGQVLAYVRHHAEPIAVANQRAALTELQSARSLAQKRVQRLKGLEGSIPRKEIETAQAELESLTARAKGIGASLEMREPLVAPISGVIARADAAAGRVAESRDVLFEVIDPTRVLVEATTADPALASHLGDASLLGIAGIQLKFIGAARSLREGSLPLTFRAKADAASDASAALPLAIGQPVTVVATLAEKTKGFAIPAQAITRSPANEPVVWIKSGTERFIPQPIQFRPLDATTVVVIQGLGPENRIVVQGASLIAQIR